MSVFEDLASATLKIECGNSRGSGFNFAKENIVVTNAHVILPCLKQQEKIVARTEQGNIVHLKLLDFSLPDAFDYAILQALDDFKEKRQVLQPKLVNPPRGTQVCFAGFPHGIDDLLVHTATVSSPFSKVGFYIDGSVNGGNSGGPVIDVNDKSAIGIVTQKRFLMPLDMDKVTSALNGVQEYVKSIQGGGGVSIMGIDFAKFAQIISYSSTLTRQVLEANASTGIGIAFRIEFVTQACKSIGVL